MFRILMQHVTAAICLAMSASHAAVVLQYHHVSDEAPPSTSVSVQQFAQHLQHLEDEGFAVLPLDVLVKRVQQGLDPYEKIAAITFDDGFADVFEHALPLLDRRGWKAALFITPSRIGQASMLSVAQLESIDQRGHLVLNHGWHHAFMIRRQGNESEEQWRLRTERDIERGQAAIEDWLGHTQPKLFAYPYGEQDPALREVLRALGYVAFGQTSGALSKQSGWQNLPRIPVNRHYAQWLSVAGASLRNKVLALPMPVSSVSPSSAVTTSSTASLSFNLPSGWQDRSLMCFASGSAIAPTSQALDDGVRVTLNAPIPTGRSRFTCTASEEGGRYYWFSWMWMRKPEHGWYTE